MLRLGLVALAGCWTGPTVVPDRIEGDVPEVELAIIRGHQVRFATASARGLVVTRMITAPATVRQLAWVRGEPVVLLGSYLDDDVTYDGRVGKLTTTGFVPLAMPPPSTWQITPPDSREHFDKPWSKIVLDRDGALWRGQCEWGGWEDGSWCDPWVYVRLVPAPAIVVRKEPPRPARRVAPAIEPAPGISLRLIHTDLVGTGDPIDLLRCKGRGRVLEFPPSDARAGFFGMSDVEWLATEPPMFRATMSVNGLEVRKHDLVFEGCALSQRFANARIEVGPHDMIALYTEQTVSVWWRGIELGSLPGGSDVEFAR